MLQGTAELWRALFVACYGDRASREMTKGRTKQTGETWLLLALVMRVEARRLASLHPRAKTAE